LVVVDLVEVLLVVLLVVELKSRMVMLKNNRQTKKGKSKTGKTNANLIILFVNSSN